MRLTLDMYVIILAPDNTWRSVSGLWVSRTANRVSKVPTKTILTEGGTRHGV